MRKIALDIIALTHSVAQTNNYTVLLGEQEGARRLPILVGGAEAQAIAIGIQGIQPKRPLTHDLFKNTLKTFNVELREVIISNLLEGVFYARLVCLKDGEIIEIDSRTSDAVALAARFECPIYTYEFILDAAGIELQEEDTRGDEGEEMIDEEDVDIDELMSDETEFARMSVDELETALSEVLSAEDYESAAKIRDEINKRK